MQGLKLIRVGESGPELFWKYFGWLQWNDPRVTVLNNEMQVKQQRQEIG